MQPTIIHPESLNEQAVQVPAQPQYVTDQPGQAPLSGSLASTQTTNEHKKSKLPIAIAAVIVIAGLLAGGYFGYGSMTKHNATKQSRTFVASLNKGDVKTAYGMSSASLQNSQSEQEFADSLGDLRAAKPVNTKETISVQGKAATYIATQTGLPEDADGNTDGTFTVELVKSGLTDWKVDSIEVN